jgi:TonB family protein
MRPRRRPLALSYVKVGTEYGGLALNFSEQGLAFHASQVPEPGHVRPIRFQLPSSWDWVESTARVVWRNSVSTEAGVEFLSLPDYARSHIREWLASPLSAFEPEPSHRSAAPSSVVESPQGPQENMREAGVHDSGPRASAPLDSRPRDSAREESSVIARSVLPVFRGTSSRAAGESGRVPLPPKQQPAPYFSASRGEAPTPLVPSMIPRYQPSSFDEAAPWEEKPRRMRVGLISNVILILLIFAIAFAYDRGLIDLHHVDAYFALAKSALSDFVDHVIPGSADPAPNAGGAAALAPGLGGDQGGTAAPTHTGVASAGAGVAPLKTEPESSGARAAEKSKKDVTGASNDADDESMDDAKGTPNEDVSDAGAAPAASREDTDSETNSTRDTHAAAKSAAAAAKIPPAPAGNGATTTPAAADTNTMLVHAPPPGHAATRVSLPEESVSASRLVAITASRSVRIPAQAADGASASQTETLEIGQLAFHSDPTYPAQAARKRIEGTVELRALVSADGTVRRVDLVSGPTLLFAAATRSVREWRYEPTLIDGRPVETEDTIRITFRLSH